MLLITNIIFVIIYIIYLLIKRNISVKKILVLSAGIILLTLQIINFASKQVNIPLSSEVFESMKKIPWNNTEKLEEIGFSNNDEYHIIHSGNDEYMCKIMVEKTSKKPDNLKTENGLMYEAYESKMGIFDYHRLFTSNPVVIRRCTFYIDGTEIYILEDNYEKNELVFEDLLITLAQQL